MSKLEDAQKWLADLKRSLGEGVITDQLIIAQLNVKIADLERQVKPTVTDQLRACGIPPRGELPTVTIRRLKGELEEAKTEIRRLNKQREAILDDCSACEIARDALPSGDDDGKK